MNNFEIEQLQKACEPVLEYLRNKKIPYSEVHISEQGIKLTTVETSIPIDDGGQYNN